MDMSFHAANCYLEDLQHKFLEQELNEITALLRDKKDYCVKIRKILQAALTLAVDNCCGQRGWCVVSDGNRHVVTECSGREHIVEINSVNKGMPISCSCHEFKRMEVVCVGIVAVLKSQGHDPFDVQWLPQQWRLDFHPLWQTAMRRLVSGTEHHTYVEEVVSNFEESKAPESLPASHIDSTLVTRWAKVSAIPTPTTANMRRAAMNNAFNSLRDDFNVPDSAERYRAFMASIFDLRSFFNGTPGQWLQEPQPAQPGHVSSWMGDARAPAPRNQANQAAHRAQPVSMPTTRTPLQADLTVRDARKKRKRGDFPSVADRRETSGDWTMYWPTYNLPTFTCPIPGCMKKPIKNSDQSRYHHRHSQNHLASLERHPHPPTDNSSASGIPGAQGTAPPVPSSAPSLEDSSGGPGIPASTVDSDSDASAGVVGTDAHEPADDADAPGCPKPIQPAFYLPQHPSFPQFKINQFCQECSVWELCNIHEAMIVQPVSPSATSASGIPGLPPLPTSDDSLGTRIEMRTTRARALASTVASSALPRRAPPPPLVIGLPEFARGKFPSDVNPRDLIKHSWGQCNAINVGPCNVWHVSTAKLSVDNIAVEDLAHPGAVYMIENRTIACDETAKIVTCTRVGRLEKGVRSQPKLIFENASDAFCAWALTKMVRDYTPQHCATFLTKDLVFVECGVGGNCFYHSCLFVLNLFHPDIRVPTTGGGTSAVAGMTHAELRTATVDHLQARYGHMTVSAAAGGSVFPLLSAMKEKCNPSATDTEIVSAYCAKHRRPTEEAEDPAVVALAHMTGIAITVYHIREREPVVANPGGRRSPVITLWCTGHHYQVQPVYTCSPLSHIFRAVNVFTGFDQ